MRGFTDGAVEREADEAQSRQQMRNQIAFGMDMEIFLQGDVGKYLQARAKVEIDEFRRKLDDIDASDEQSIRNIQQEIAVRKIWKDWLQLAIQEGAAAQDTAIERNSL